VQGDLQAHGWSGPYRLLADAEQRTLLAECLRIRDRFSMPTNSRSHDQHTGFLARRWFKSMHVFSAPLLSLVRRPEIVSRITPILGPDVIAWGCTLIQRSPGQTHRWHVDVEHLAWKGATVFVGLQNSRHAGLKFMNGSHMQDLVPQVDRIQSDLEALRVAQLRDRASTISEPMIDDGSFVLFDGRVWHSSHNQSPADRYSVIIQYATASARVRIPMNWDPPISWHANPPTCALVAGEGTEALVPLTEEPIPFDLAELH
jgi:hypothetical protein